MKFHYLHLMKQINENKLTQCFGILNRGLKYVQGQSPQPNVREYFYYIDHQGMLFMDDVRIKNFTSCFKEKKFLEFFFKRVKFNDTGKYEEEFPYLSPCGREKNYIRCDDLPIVFTHFVVDAKGEERLSYGYTDALLTLKFEPEKLCMLPQTGRVYHPGPPKVGGVGLVKSSLAIELSPNFRFSPDDVDRHECPTHFTWKGTTCHLTNEILEALATLSSLQKCKYPA